MKQIGAEDAEAMAVVLTDAFWDDPFNMWLYPDRNRRERMIASWTNQLRIVYVPKGHSYATEDMSGAALWSPPGDTKLKASQQLRLFVPYLRILGPRQLPTALKGFAVIDEARPSQPHWYLSVLGVTPDRQRSGGGRSLIEPMLERSDREQTLVHLETFKAHNVPYYERFGFVVTGEDEIPDGGPHMWAMARQPQ